MLEIKSTNKECFWWAHQLIGHSQGKSQLTGHSQGKNQWVWRLVMETSFVVVQLLCCVTLRPHGLLRATLPCPSLSPRACSNLCPLRWWCHPTVSSSVTLFFSQSFPASGSFSRVGCSQKVAKVLELQLSISPSNEYSGLISFRIDWFDLSAVQGTLKNLLQWWGGRKRQI